MQCLPVAKLLDQNYATEADVWLEMNGDSLRLKDSKRRISDDQSGESD
jgi:hypothetical protein